MDSALAQISHKFQFAGKFLDITPFGRGHIHDSFVARFRTADGVIHRYLLQRLNRRVFPDLEALMENVSRVTAHLRDKIAAAGGDPNRGTLTLIPTVAGEALLNTEEAGCWRAYALIEEATTYDLARNPDDVYQAALVIGDFQRLLSDFPTHTLHETIPDFHHTPKRFQAFAKAVVEDRFNRAKTIEAEIAFVENRSHEMGILLAYLASGQVPERVTHNDTKLNNVLIDVKTGESLCLVDLDTVMPGLSLYDFGDAVRTGANQAAEDEPNQTQSCIDLTLFDRYVQGYLEATHTFLTSTEIDQLAFSARLMTLECGMRFLTDYLNGDTYFKIRRAGQNLDRCQVQFAMVGDMEAKYERMVRIVERHRREH